MTPAATFESVPCTANPIASEAAPTRGQLNDFPLGIQEEQSMKKPKALPPLEAVNKIRHDNNGQVVLVLQGGGALGAYQGGVYQALHESGAEPDWIIGTSIGAINASIIAGNAVEQRLPRLQEFWRRVEGSTFWGAFPAWTGVADALSSWTILTSGIPGFFEINTRALLGVQVPLGADHASYCIAVFGLDVFWVRIPEELHHGAIADALGKQSWLNAFVAFGAIGAGVLLLLWVSTCTSAVL